MNPLVQAAQSLGSPRSGLEVVARAALAFALGAAVAGRPWRRLWGGKGPRPENVQSQILIAVAGSLMIWVIGDSVARAFGLVGLGGFVRFRAGVKDARDAALLFLMIALGMACGAGEWTHALLAAGVVATALAVLDFAGRGAPESSAPSVSAAEGPP